jgi:hypothetical protein
VVAVHCDSVFYKDEGGKSNVLTLAVSAPIGFLMPPEPIPLQVSLYYEKYVFYVPVLACLWSAGLCLHSDAARASTCLCCGSLLLLLLLLLLSFPVLGSEKRVEEREQSILHVVNAGDNFHLTSEKPTLVIEFRLEKVGHCYNMQCPLQCVVWVPCACSCVFGACLSVRCLSIVSDRAG